jgi:hypothetical protein
MRQEIKQYLAVGSSLMLSIASLIGVPVKAHALSNQPEIKPKKEVKLVIHVWNKFTLKAYTKAYMNENYPEWGRSEWTALKKLWGKESAWNHEADNPTSSAYGVAQVLNTDPKTPAPRQVAKGLEYIVHRYDLPSVAWSHWRKNGWY